MREWRCCQHTATERRDRLSAIEMSRNNIDNDENAILRRVVYWAIYQTQLQLTRWFQTNSQYRGGNVTRLK